MTEYQEPKRKEVKSVPTEKENGEALVEKIESDIRSFINNPALLSLMQEFGFEPSSEQQSLKDKLATIKAFTNATWDFRGGRERYQASHKEFTPEQEERIVDYAEKFGMVKAIVPKKSKYDAILILGAIGKQPLQRTEYAKMCGAEASLIVSLGTENPLPTDRSAISDYAPDAQTEFDLMKAAIEHIYQRPASESHIYGSLTEARPLILDPSFPGSKNEDEHGVSALHADNHPSEIWRISHFSGTEGEPDIYALSAPSSDPQVRRANTADTYAFLSRVLPNTAENILLVTCSIFQPFQQFDAERMLTLPFGKNVETAGFDTRQSKSHKPQNYLQEINSAVNSAWLLNEATQSPTKR